MKKAVIYIHGQGGSAAEAAHYVPLFPACGVLGFDYAAQTPREAREEFTRFFESVFAEYDAVTVVANSLGAYFAMNADNAGKLSRAFFISPVTDMERLITDMMSWASVTEAALREKGEIETAFGQTLSWDYLSYVRAHPVKWEVPTCILCAERDELVAFEGVSAFAEEHGAALTVMPGGEHWFHTEEEMAFLDAWIRENAE